MTKETKQCCTESTSCHEGWIIFFAIICPFGLIAYALYKYLKCNKNV